MKKLFLMLLLGFGITAFSQDSTNTFDYNYKKGMEHYNKGVDILNKYDFKPNERIACVELVIPKDSTDSVMVQAKREFNSALPFLLKSYSIDSKNEKVLTALQGIYFSMYDFKESDRYKNELELLKKKNKK